MPKNYLTRFEFVELMKDIDKNKISSVRFKLISQIITLVKMNGRRLEIDYPPSIDNSAKNPLVFRVMLTFQQVEIINSFCSKVENKKSQMGRERQAQVKIGELIEKLNKIGVNDGIKFMSLD